MPDPDVRIAFRGTTAYRAKIQRAALDRGVKVQDLIERAIDAFLDSVPNPIQAKGVQRYPERDIPAHDALQKLLDSQDRRTISAVLTLCDVPDHLPRRSGGSGQKAAG